MNAHRTVNSRTLFSSRGPSNVRRLGSNAGWTVRLTRSIVVFPIVMLAVVISGVCSSRSAHASDAKALTQQVKIRRTQFGVPHISGETLEAGAFGFGYCQAEDHLLEIL